MGILFTTLGFALFAMFGVTLTVLGICSLFIGSVADKMGSVCPCSVRRSE